MSINLDSFTGNNAARKVLELVMKLVSRSQSAQRLLWRCFSQRLEALLRENNGHTSVLHDNLVSGAIT